MNYEELVRKGRILMVDDNVGSLCLLENVLNRLGFPNLRKLSDPTQILPEFDSYEPDLIISDLDMPVLDGMGLVRRLREHLAGRDTFLPVLVLTGSSDARAKRNCLVAGATDILFKPFDSSEIQMRIRNLLRIRFQHLQIQSQNTSLESKVAERTTELEQALSALESSQQQVVQQERFRAFGEMAGGVVHDFNNSLMSVIGYSELLLQDDSLLNDPATVREYLRTMNTAGRDASQVVSRLRDFYRPREETDVFTATDVNRLLEQIVPLTRPKWHDQALQTGRVITVDLELQKTAQVSCNGTELREVLTNCIFNAVDAMPAGGTITLRSQDAGSFVQIEIADTGLGMTEAVRLRCMEPFFSTKGEAGTGLGLSMSFGIIRRHEGMIEIDSVLGQGTTLRVRLPAYHEIVPASQTAHPKLDRALEILVADDDANTCEIVAEYLRSDGHRVTTVANGAEALKRTLKDSFDLLIVDQAMPFVTGTQLAEVVRKIQPERAIILVSGFPISAEGKPACVDQILKKPLVRDELRRALHLAVG